MLAEMNETEAIESIGPFRILLDEVFTPGASEPFPNSTYRPEYEWLFGYERKLAKIVSPWLEHLRYELIGEKGILGEALSNAFSHGHGKDPALPISVRIYQGEKGLLIRVTDSGPGFNVKAVVKDYHRGRAYFHLAGNGIRQMISSHWFEIFYTARGASFHLLYRFSQEDKKASHFL